MMVQTFDNLDEVLRRANDTPYGLAAFIFGKDLNMLTKAWEGLHFGVIGVNDMVPATAEAPFGGMKESGIGRENSVEGIMEYVEVKSISIALS
jgi:succinate-semialdehyde dehydrogenase/glutarate-semialdehyde dehydrogenase